MDDVLFPVDRMPPRIVPVLERRSFAKTLLRKNHFEEFPFRAPTHIVTSENSERKEPVTWHWTQT